MDLALLKTTALTNFKKYFDVNTSTTYEDDSKPTTEFESQLHFLKNNQQFNLDVYHNKQESKERILGRLIATEKLKDTHLVGISKVIGADVENGLVLREAELGKTVNSVDLKEIDFAELRFDFLDLMLCLDKLFSLGIEAAIDADNISLDFDDFESTNKGFSVNNYFDNPKILNLEISQRRALIVSELEKNILPYIRKANPESAEDIERVFNTEAKVFQDIDYLQYNKIFEREAKDFEPHLSSILSKFDQIDFANFDPKQDLSSEENDLILGFGGECITIKSSHDDTKVAKIYYPGFGGAVNEIQSIHKARYLAGTAVPIAMRDNVVIETKLEGVTLDEYIDNNSFFDPACLDRFISFLPKFFHSLNEIYRNGVFPDASFNDILFDPKQGFSFPDLSVLNNRERSFSVGQIMNSFQSLISDPERLKQVDDIYHAYITDITEDD